MKAALEGQCRYFVQEAIIDREMKQYTKSFPAIYLFNQEEIDAGTASIRL